jgi:1,4-dihydroxy-2-naphthoate octaprenyltransferase
MVKITVMVAAIIKMFLLINNIPKIKNSKKENKKTMPLQ